MIFTSNIFLFLYLPLYLACYYLARPQWRSAIIVAGSYLFYAWWRPDFLFLFVAVTYWNYFFGDLINKHRDSDKKKAFRILCVGVSGNLAALGYFKYANFGADVLGAALESFGLNTFTLEHIILPLGISFYIFQAISYIVDIYRKEAEKANNFIDFAAFVALFPQLIAGPILHYRDVDKQLKKRNHSWDLFSLGVCRFMLGFIKKVLIADSLAPISEQFLSNPDVQMADAWFGSAVSLIQLYFDFSGYSDMAIGLGMMMGFKFTENFNQPFLAKSLSEFWRRWHLTLANFLMHYVYRPLVRTVKLSPDVALFCTMILSGIWHGASVSFVCFGLSFAILMVLERRFNLVTSPSSPYNAIRNIITVIFLLMIMPFFTTGSLSHSLAIYRGMSGLDGVGSLNAYVIGTSSMAMMFVACSVIWLVIAGWINVRFARTKGAYLMQNVAGWQAVLLWLGFALAVSKLAANSFSPFLYFQF
ncbi:MBOAT family O-acyltransferase [Gilvimarinus agarilyticus]|uniref:MBOAT family O-acyltransferase n=1 Tax=Gilvimarinus agarilyticus TaxID=679259 RepID=UPI0005A00373|nr:MBOAT family O-acyltransferase [Gilvimarinus agarilyticus]